MKGTAGRHPLPLSIQGKVGRFQRRPQAESPKMASPGRTIDGSDRVPIRRWEVLFDICTNMDPSPKHFSF